MESLKRKLTAATALPRGWLFMSDNDLITEDCGIIIRGSIYRFDHSLWVGRRVALYRREVPWYLPVKPDFSTCPEGYCWAKEGDLIEATDRWVGDAASLVSGWKPPKGHIGDVHSAMGLGYVKRVAFMEEPKSEAPATKAPAVNEPVQWATCIACGDRPAVHYLTSKGPVCLSCFNGTKRLDRIMLGWEWDVYANGSEHDRQGLDHRMREEVDRADKGDASFFDRPALHEAKGVERLDRTLTLLGPDGSGEDVA